MGAAFNAMMEEDSKEQIAERCCQLMDEIEALKRENSELIAQNRQMSLKKSPDDFFRGTPKKHEGGGPLFYN